MAKSRLIGDYPVIGIRPTIDGRRGTIKVRESLEDQTMNMAKSAAKLIEEKIQLARNYTDAVMKFYCFCGFDRNDRWNDDFWRQDIFNLLFRIEILMRNRCLPYVMRFARYTESPYRGMYVTIARWCNQPSFFKKKSLREFAIANGTDSACYRYLTDFEQRFTEVTSYLDMKFK